MAVNKNFVVKNGLEVSTNLILADVDSYRVGIGTSIADYTLHVNGGIGATDLYVSGIATFASIDVTNDVIFVDLDSTNINVTGIGTIVNAALTNITGTAATIGSVQIASGIVTAASGIVTYYGDGGNLTGIVAGVGIRTEGSVAGYGITFLDFRGAGVSTITAPVSGISTINITGGGGGGSISISTTAPPSPSGGDLWYSPDRARTFIYYDESEVGYGTSKQWIDASPFNVGVLSATSISVGSLSLSNNLNVSGITTVGSLDSGNINSSGIITATSVTVGSAVTANSTGIIVVGVVTATSFVGSLSGTATNATNITLADESSDTTCFPLFATDATGNQAPKTDASALTYNAANSTLSATTFSGNATTATTATNATNITLADESSDPTCFPLFATDATGNQAPKTDSSSLIYNASTGQLTSVDFNATSDINLKKDIEVITDATDLIKQLNGVRFAWKANDRKSLGVIAQEVEELFPELISERTDTGTKSVNYNGLVGVLIEAVKELSERVGRLEKE